MGAFDEPIPIKSEIETFKEHLDIEGNDRIFFSGKFGSGKTYFLKEFFNVSQFKDKYNALHLFPVNYSVASNEDIFELIKADLIVRILDDFSDNLKFEKFDLNWEWALFLSLRKHPEYLIPFIAAIPKVGSSIKAVLDGIQKLHEGIQEKGGELNFDAHTELLNHVKWLGEKVGSVYEENTITKVLQSCIGQLSGQISDKQSILILDDLDRIDPDHIFRILNVFAAHFDNPFDESAKNKFSFDKVILVGDAENVRSIFHHRYGSSTDFSGYLDKFYSKRVYDFSLKSRVQNVVLDLIKTIKQRYPGSKGLIAYDNRLEFISEFIYEVLVNLVKSNAINLRSLTKINEMEVNMAKLGTLSERSINELVIAHAGFFLMELLGSKEETLAKIELIDKIEFSNEDSFDYLVPNILMLSNAEHIDFKRTKSNVTVIGYNGLIQIDTFFGSETLGYASFAENSPDRGRVEVKRELMKGLTFLKSLL